MRARGSRPGRIARLLSIGLAVALSTVVATGGAANADVADRAPAGAPTGVDDFTFASFDGDYRLGRDAQGHSTLTTVETLVARFPTTDQNHGIRRALVEDYDGHPTDLQVVSVTDQNGSPRPYTSESSSGIRTLTIAAKDFVHGDQTYVITYRQTNVTRYFADTGNDEFYWDTNGTEWAQPFDRVTAAVYLGPGLAAALRGDTSAYRGAQGSTDPANVERTGDGFRFSADRLGAGENLTFAIGFAPGTFTPRSDGLFDTGWGYAAVAGLLIGLLTLIGAIVVRVRLLRDAPGRGTIVPEYVPPKEGLLLAADVAGLTKKAVPAQTLDLAVSGRVRVLEAAKGFFGHPSYTLELVSTEATGRQALRDPHPTADELRFLQALFGESVTPGSTLELGSSNTRVAQSITALTKRVHKGATGLGYRTSGPRGPVSAVFFTALAATVLAVAGSVLCIVGVYGGAVPFGIAAGAVVLFIVSAVLVSRSPLTSTGTALREYVDGLRMYVHLAEADRIRYLQSPQGAERVPVAVDDPREMLKLNERLLPWAVLFGDEKKWLAELGRFYEQAGEAPTWYAGQTAFNVAVLSQMVSGISSSTTMANSSSSGGTGGGGFSGGGGGGGGGGGV
ncbi:DUF2207 domain-containing protein [Leifsonia shinshuensis]|uniref:DUF2207 domain-containing protein n=1 Tax=Leifsonia shinshuensis TaxID=150026 RepID=UPI001F50EEC2|nr:DUF2207 domain-containing protein [Leifsonia shinshuensis]MCI0157079.1 DUF2207 domain-containing protein [Leifsonia shinshuensis]